ncbi:uncharacterized protein EDB93DRAFT_1246520 [Suillus bovinus]|uniref:uncharacterized protein n=1 Tax=Suillus bovinus TaxID=48563 RepID=UPI001B87828E|nr:uncharacterized protein EDB93DRAFT_1246520 [Suillus bovinus]KAG2158029.1 hypothetical protein EDB93DRAFT_1246520 [Suillus bovinus]
MSNFDLSLLDPPCSPSPEAEAPVEAALVVKEPAQEIPEAAPVVESTGDRVLHIWNTLLPSVGVLLGSHPKLLQEHLEDIESWLHEWVHFEANVHICMRDALEAEVLLPIGDEEKEILQDFNEWVGVARKTVSGWKEVAEKIMAEACVAHAAKEKGKGKERKENPDMGKLKAGTSTKCKASETAVAPCKVPCVAKEHIPMVKPTTADDANDSGESEVEVQEVPKKVHPVPRLVKPLPMCTAAGPSRVRADDLDNERLRADNKHLREEARKQQQELIAMSNQLYLFSDEWRMMGQEMDDFIVGQERA